MIARNSPPRGRKQEREVEGGNGAHAKTQRTRRKKREGNYGGLAQAGRQPQPSIHLLLCVLCASAALREATLLSVFPRYPILPSSLRVLRDSVVLLHSTKKTGRNEKLEIRWSVNQTGVRDDQTSQQKGFESATRTLAFRDSFFSGGQRCDCKRLGASELWRLEDGQVEHAT